MPRESLSAERRAQLLTAFTQAGVPQDEAENVIALYGKRDASPPPLPPRLANYGLETDRFLAEESESSILLPSAADSPPSKPIYSTESEPIRILVIDELNGAFSVVAEAHLEFLRVYTACKTGRWLFQRTCSAGLYVESRFRSEAGSTLRCRPRILYTRKAARGRALEL